MVEIILSPLFRVIMPSWSFIISLHKYNPSPVLDKSDESLDLTKGSNIYSGIGGDSFITSLFYSTLKRFLKIIIIFPTYFQNYFY